MRARGVGRASGSRVRMWLVIVLVIVMALWLVVTKPAESAAAIGHVTSSIRLFIASF